MIHADDQWQKEEYNIEMGQVEGKPVEAGAKHYVLGTDYTKDYFVSCPEGFECAVFGSGCFWGSEKAFWYVTSYILLLLIIIISLYIDLHIYICIYT